MSRVRNLHNAAMQKARAADDEFQNGNSSIAKQYYFESCQLEAEAASLIPVDSQSEPTRSILYSSAASLALQASDNKLAIRLVAEGLRGFPPQHIENDLKDIYEKANFEYHLQVRGVVLEERDLQLSLQGKDVGPGFISYYQFDKRIKNIDVLLKRTFQRKINLKFQDARKKSNVNPFVTALSIPRAASFAVSVRLLRQTNIKDSLPLPFKGSSAEEILDDVIVCLELVNDGKEDELKKIIYDEAYFTHFLWHAREIAPDGEKVSIVGLTTQKKKIALRRPKSDFSVNKKTDFLSCSECFPVSAEGYLDYASKRESRVGLSTKDGKEYFVLISDGMEDLVRSNFGKQVVVSGMLAGNEITPEDISAIEE